MDKNHIIIGFGILFFVIGTLLAGTMLVSKFGPVILDGDSVLPHTIGVLLTFTLWDYFLTLISAVSYISGLYILILGISLNITKKNQALQKKSIPHYFCT
jgi:hypothetical protein